MNPTYLNNDMTEQIPLQISEQQRKRHERDVCMRPGSAVPMRTIVLEGFHSIGANITDEGGTGRHWQGKSDG